MFTINKDIALFDNNLTFFFSCISANEESFYVMCWDHSYNEVEKEDVNGKIYQFDYDGKLLKILQPNQGIQSFVVADKSVYSIGLDHVSKEWTVYKGEIK